jgi:hypothetical protein
MTDGEVEFQARSEDRSALTPATNAALRTVAAVFVYVVAFIALRLLPNPTYVALLNTGVQVVGDAACVALAFVAARSAVLSWRGFFRAISIASSFLLLANLAWGFVINIWAIDPNTTIQSLAYRVPYLLCLCFWTVAWLELVVRHVNRGASIGLFLTALAVGGALAALLVQYYGPLIFDSANPHRVFVFLYVGLEIAALILCVGAAIVAIQPYPVLIAVGYALLVAADFVFNTNELRNTVAQNSFVEIPWTVAQVCVAIGVGLQSRLLAMRSATGQETAPDLSAHFAVPLLITTLGVGLGSSLIARFVDTDTVAFGCYLFGTALIAISVSMLARAQTRAVGNALQHMSDILKRGAGPFVGAKPVGVLRLFGSAAILNQAQKYLREVREQTLPHGRDRMFSIEEAWSAERPRRVFIAMPFALPWSASTDAWLRKVTAELDWSACRADELFDTRDALAGIWKGICEAEVVVADLTERSPNVLYEVGLAHCLGKPVVLTCQRPDDIPFDLATRRVVIYNLAQLDEATPRLRSALLGCVRQTG